MEPKEPSLGGGHRMTMPGRWSGRGGVEVVVRLHQAAGVGVVEAGRGRDNRAAKVAQPSRVSGTWVEEPR